MAKVMISVPDELLERVDAEAARRGTTRSGLIRDTLGVELERRDPERIRGALRTMQELGRRWPAGVTTDELLAQDKADRDAHDARHAGL
jgi:predicted transcriptional regulator